MAIFDEPAAKRDASPGKLVLRYNLVVGVIGLALIALMAYVGWLIAFFLPTLVVVGVLSARLGAAAGFISLLGPIALAVVWGFASYGAAVTAFPEDEVSQSWTALFLFLGVAATVIVSFIASFIGASGAAGARHLKARKAEQAAQQPPLGG